MGTKVQCESYLPGYYTMRDPGDNSSSGWFLYNDRTSNGHLYDGFSLKTMNGCFNYDLETVKRTILEHDAIFRRQVYELHRLYRVQKDLMKELEMKKIFTDSGPWDASQPSSSLFGVSKRMSQLHHLAEVSNSYREGFATANDERRKPLNFQKENDVQCYPMFSTEKENGVPQKDGEPSDLKITKFPKRMLDLELPADCYIDIEDVESTETENVGSSVKAACSPIKVKDVLPENDVKLTLGVSKGSSSREVCSLSYSYSQNASSAQRFAGSNGRFTDLNEPIQDTYFNKVTDPILGDFFGRKSHNEEIQNHHYPTKSCTNFLAGESDVSKDRHRNEEASSKLFCAKERREPSLFSNEAGHRRSVSSSHGPNLHAERSLLSKVKPEKAYENYSADQSRNNKWFGEMPTYLTEDFDRNSRFASSSGRRPSASQTAHPSLVPQKDYLSSAFPLVSTTITRKPANGVNHIPIAIQALPCFTNSLATSTRARSSKSITQNQNHGDARDGWRNGDLMSRSVFDGESSSYPDSIRHGSRSEAVSALEPHLTSLPLGKLNLSKFGDNLSCANFENRGPQQGFKSLQLPDMNSKTDYKDRAIMSEMQPRRSVAMIDINQKVEESSGGLSWLKAKQPSTGSNDKTAHQDYPHAIFNRGGAVRESEKKQEKEANLSMPTCQDSASVLDIKERRIRRNEVHDLPSTEKILGIPIIDRMPQTSLYSIPTSHEELSLTAKMECSKVYTNQVCLNSKGTCLDVSESSKAAPVLKISPAKVTGIDLEAPIYGQGEEWVNDPISRLAAENIIFLTSDTRAHLKDSDTNSHASPPISCHSLYQLAEVVVSSVMDNIRCSDNDELDSFEYMTLQLEEVKADEYSKWSSPREQQSTGDAEKTVPSLLMDKPRRGRRRRRQRRDFQKDILPGLVTLSRHEVTEDIQTFGAMMRAAGVPWQTGSSRRGTGGTRGRGRRRTRNVSVTVSEAPPSPPPTQAPNAEAEANAASMIGWGRTTRRCRRQRYQSGTIPAILT